MSGTMNPPSRPNTPVTTNSDPEELPEVELFTANLNPGLSNENSSDANPEDEQPFPVSNEDTEEYPYIKYFRPGTPHPFCFKNPRFVPASPRRYSEPVVGSISDYSDRFSLPGATWKLSHIWSSLQKLGQTSRFLDKILTKSCLFISYAMFGVAIGFTLAFLVHYTVTCDRTIPSDKRIGEDSYPHLSSNGNLHELQNELRRINIDDEIAKLDNPNLLQLVSGKCQNQNVEYLEQIQVLEDEISSMRHQFSSRLAEKEHQTKRLVGAIKDFKQRHLSLNITSLWRCLDVILISALSCFIARKLFSEHFRTNLS